MTLGGWMVIGLIAWGAWWVYKNLIRVENGEGKITSKSETVMLRTIEIPNDAHDAVEAFARLAGQTRNMLKHMGGHDSYFDFVQIRLKYGADDYSGIAEFSMDFDYSMESFHKAVMNCNLGEGFEIDGDKVFYRSQRIQGMRRWGSSGKFLEDAIIATVENNCADAYKSVGGSDETGAVINFKFL